jgi:hypothetical protein
MMLASGGYMLQKLFLTYLANNNDRKRSICRKEHLGQKLGTVVKGLSILFKRKPYAVVVKSS